MPTIPSISGLHMRYRLWIAEMNYYINILRILEDYLIELSPKSHEDEIKNGASRFKDEFVAIRKEIDDLRHEMHILKMKLAAYAREGQTITAETFQSDNHDTIEKRFIAFQQKFEKTKKDFESFEAKWGY